jgi:transcriptional antiterminator NusG
MVMTDDTWYVVRNTRGCAGFVGPEGKPVPLTEDEIKRALGSEVVAVEVAYEVGDLVNVIDGPLEGFSGTVEEIDAENNSVQVIVSMFGRDTAVDFELDQLEKVED